MEAFGVDDSFVSDFDQFDLTLIVDKHKIHVLKAVLCIASPVFRTMFSSDFKEKEQNEIQLPGKNYNDVVSFLKCIYPNQIENVTIDTVYRVLPLAVEYQVNALIKNCQDFLIQLVKSKHNDAMEICKHIQISEQYNLGDLNQKSVSIASEFPLRKFEKASKMYPFTDDSLIKVHRHARMREELNKNDDISFYSIEVFRPAVREFIENQKSFRSTKQRALQALRLCYRYFPDDLELFERANRAYNYVFYNESNSDIDELVSLLPEMLKQKMGLK